MVNSQFQDFILCMFIYMYIYIYIYIYIMYTYLYHMKHLFVRYKYIRMKNTRAYAIMYLSRVCVPSFSSHIFNTLRFNFFHSFHRYY